MENGFVRRFWLRTVRHFLDLIIIDSLRKESFNGNRLKQYVHDKHGVTISSDAMYKRLRSLAKQGLIEPDAKTQPNGRGKFYVTTKQGIDFLNSLLAYREETKTFLAALLT